MSGISTETEKALSDLFKSLDIKVDRYDKVTIETFFEKKNISLEFQKDMSDPFGYWWIFTK